MVQNIAIVGLYRPFAYDVAKKLATELDMHFFDCLELFEFDNIPRNLTVMLREFGESYYRKKEVGMLKYVSEFNETVINLESGMCKKLENFSSIKSNCLLIYLHQPASQVEKKLNKQKYNSSEEKNFFLLGADKINKRIELFKKNSDIVVNCSRASSSKVCYKVLDAIRAFYKVEKNN